MLPLPPDQQKSKPPKQQQQVKVTRLPTNRPSLQSSSPSSANPNLSSELPLNQSIPPISSLNPNPQPNLELNRSTPFDPPTRPEPIATRQRSTASSSPIRTSISRSQQQQSKKQEEQQQSTEEPKRSQPTPQPTPSSSDEPPTRAQPTPQPTPSQPDEPPTRAQPTPQPTPSQPDEEPTVKTEETGGDYSKLGQLLQSDNPTLFQIALKQVEHDTTNNLKAFEPKQDINKLIESNKFKDSQGQPDIRFNFFKTAVSPLTTQDITSFFKTQLSGQGFSFTKIGNYGGGPLYEVAKGDFKRYLIFAPGKDEQVDITAIVVSQNDPR